jgi:linoleoyl-CoA desaturase
MINHKFSPNLNADFTKSLKQRVNAYFQENDVSKNANTEMVLKTISALSIYLLPFLTIIIFTPTSIPLLFLLWMIMGFGMGFMGTSVFHDSLHGSYAKNKKINFLIGAPAWMLGADPTIWKMQHNVLHHTYTNVEHADEDIQPRFVMRFSPNQPLRWFHKYQHIYSLFFYSLSTVLWVTVKDFSKLFQYKKLGLIKSGRAFNLKFAEVALRKITYHLFFLGLPLLLLDLPVGLIIGMFFTMHLVAGTVLSMVFQPAHVIHTSDYIDTEEINIERNWSVHQLMTTTNFGMNNKLLFWFTGGLNHQIEHHLFPNICHIHYKKLAPIVMETAKEFNLPYYHQPTFSSAVIGHFRMLRDLGSGRV